MIPCHLCIYWTPEHGCDHYGPDPEFNKPKDMQTTIIGSGKPQEPQTIGRPVDTDHTFFRKDKSGRDGHYSIFLSDLLTDESEHEDDEEFIEWAENAEIGDEYHEFNDRTYLRTS